MQQYAHQSDIWIVIHTKLFFLKNYFIYTREQIKETNFHVVEAKDWTTYDRQNILRHQCNICHHLTQLNSQNKLLVLIVKTS